MDEFEQSDLERKTNGSHNIFYQNAFITKLLVKYIFFCFCYKTRRTYDWDLLSRTTYRKEPEGLTKFIIM